MCLWQARRSKKELYSKGSFFKASPIGTEVEVCYEWLPSVSAQSIAQLLYNKYTIVSDNTLGTQVDYILFEYLL